MRKLCPHCKVPFEADDETALALGMIDDGPRTLYRAEGCLRCEYQGYRGRMALQEIRVSTRSSTSSSCAARPPATS